MMSREDVVKQRTSEPGAQVDDPDHLLDDWYHHYKESRKRPRHSLAPSNDRLGIEPGVSHGQQRKCPTRKPLTIELAVDGKDKPYSEPSTLQLEACVSLTIKPLKQLFWTKELGTIRNCFLTELITKEVRTNKNGTAFEARFPEEDIKKIDRLFFQDLMGPASFDRLSELLKAYNTELTTDNEGGSVAVANRAAEIAKDTKVALSIRKYFWILEKQQRALAEEQGPLLHLHQLVTSLALLEEHEHLCFLAENRDAGIIAFLEAYGGKGKVGVCWKDRVCEYTRDFYNHKHPSKLNNDLRNWRQVRHLVDDFGEGILPLLPQGAIGR